MTAKKDAPKTATNTLKHKYTTEIVPKLQKDLGLKNVMQVPKIKKITVNIGIGAYLQKNASKDYKFVIENITKITGQKPIEIKAKKSISNFKVREGMVIGVMCTLRGERAYNFLEKLIHIVFPRVRDFRGVNKKAIDKHGNCNFGFKEHTVFPEGMIADDAKKTHGLQVTITTNAQDRAHTEALLRAFDFPLHK